MPHRGRLNVLANVMHKPMPEILEEFISGTMAADDSGQVLVFVFEWGQGARKEYLTGKEYLTSKLALPMIAGRCWGLVMSSTAWATRTPSKHE